MNTNDFLHSRGCFAHGFHRLKTVLALWPAALALVLAACAPANRAPAPATIPRAPAETTPAVSTPTLQAEISPSPVTWTAQCLEELVPPNITEVQPARGVPGGEIKVIGSGGYVMDSCGFYNESARTFDLYLDNELAGELSCYVNYCQGKKTLLSAITPGTHCLSVQKDRCEFEFEVAAPGSAVQ